MFYIQRIKCHNPGTWHNFSQEKLTSGESCQRTNCKREYKLESQNPLGNKCASLTWEQSFQWHLGTIVPVSPGNSCTSLTWKQLCQSNLGTIVSVSIGNYCASLTWERLCQSHLWIIVPASLENNCASVIWEQLCQCHLGKIVPVSLANNCTSVIWENLWQCHLRTIMPVSLGNNCGSVTWVQLCQFHLGTILPVQFGNKSKLIYFRFTKRMRNDIRYIISFSLQNLNTSIYYNANKGNTFSNFLLAKIYEYFIIYEQSALMQAGST